MSQRALKYLIDKTDEHTHTQHAHSHARTRIHTHSHTRIHIYAHTHVEKHIATCQNNTHAHTLKQHPNIHRNNTLANGKQTIQTPIPKNITKLFHESPDQSQSHSTKAYTIQPKPVYHTAFPQRIEQLLSYTPRHSNPHSTGHVSARCIRSKTTKTIQTQPVKISNTAQVC